MLKKIITASIIAATLSGCETMDNVSQGLDKYNNMLAGKPAPKKVPSKNWGVSDNQAMAYLAHDKVSYLSNKVDWSKFWAWHIHYKTPLFKKASKYCDVKAWDSRKVGKNCGDFAQIEALTHGQEMAFQDFGN